VSKHWKRFRLRPLRDQVGVTTPKTNATTQRDQDILGAIWEALNIARDNKALVIARAGTIVNINPLVSQLCGRPLEQLVGGMVTTELFDGPSETAAEHWETALKTSSGELIAVEVARQSLGARLPEFEVYAIRDLRGRQEAAEARERQNRTLRQSEEELRAQNEKFDAALDNMLQGLAMFDAEQRLIVCNKRYAQMYGLTPEQVKPGTTVRQIFEYRLVNGFYHVKDADGFVGSWTSGFGEVSSRIQELADGRFINVARHQMANGGRLVTHEDITERQKLSAQLEKQHLLLQQQDETLQAQNIQLDAALNNMVQGLAMFDAELRLVIANERYAEIYDLESAQLKPGTHLREIVEYRVAKGQYGAKPVDEVLNSMLTRATSRRARHHVTELADGRFIAISVQPMINSGIVTTHQDITEQRRSEAKIAHMAVHDTLTALPNRALLNERLEQALARAKRGEMVAIHILDLDHFKHVNDTLGHPIGDKLLQMVGDRLRLLVRDADTIARMGGDEFAIVQVALSQIADATSLAQRVIAAVSEPYEIGGHLMVIGTSVGIAVAPSDGLIPEELIKNGDLALYRAKGDGRGTFRFFEPSMDAQMQARRSLEQDLRKALTAGEFELHYQPVVNLAHNKINGFEALIRWRHPEKGLVSPATFIPLAEETGLIVSIGEWVIRQACAIATQWPADMKIAVNLSPVQLRSPGLLPTIVSTLATSGLAADRLELEITETVLLQDSEATLATLYQLRELGVHIAMDDFGTGYSSLSHLQRFPFDKIKIDRSFINNMADNVSSLNIVRAVAALASGLGVTATAEGVETQEQLEAIRSEGCTEMQGYLLSKPIPADQIEQFFLSRGMEQKSPQNVAAA
jgi:diguanylate cyclase (GGDEF)-like protein